MGTRVTFTKQLAAASANCIAQVIEAFDTAGKKRCNACNYLLPLSDFNADERAKDGYNGSCRKCEKQRRIENRICDIPIEKICRKCQATKPIASFHVNRRNRDGHKSICDACSNQQSKDYVSSNGKRDKEKTRDAWLWFNYRIRLVDFNKLLASQGGVCAICRTPPRGTESFDVDHDHTSGGVRGILCSPCNRGLGQFTDSADLCRKAAEYLDKFEGA